jgi:radical SAM protein with 4Fe4S-binding SPASM domain
VNLLVIDRCDQSCPCCFARHYMAESAKPREMGVEDFRTVLAFLARSGHTSFQMAGGEPTLHRRFTELLDLAIAGGFRVGILSNGLFGEEVRSHLVARLDRFDSLLLNVNEPSSYEPERWEALRANLAVLAEKALLGVNIHRVGQDLDHLLDLAREFPVVGLRFVFAHQSGRSESPDVLRYEDIPGETDRLVDLVDRAGTELGVMLVYDCGFLPCLFDETQLAVLRKWGCVLGGCEPSNLTVDPDLRVSHCFNREDPARVVNLRDFDTADSLEAFFREAIRHDTAGRFLFEECRSCPELRAGTCGGGCVADRRILDVPLRHPGRGRRREGLHRI